MCKIGRGKEKYEKQNEKTEKKNLQKTDKI